MQEQHEYITETKARECLEIVKKYLGQIDGGWAVLYPPGHEGPMWVVSLEGCGDWAIRISQDEEVTWPEGVFTEPVAHWCLGLYPAREKTPAVRYPDCEVQLAGTSANAVAIIVKVQRGLKRYLVDEAGMTREEAEAEAARFSEEARSGDYDNVLMTCHRWVSVS